MEKDEKIKIAITAGIAAVILLILLLFLAFGRTRSGNEDSAKMEENILGYAEGEDVVTNPDASVLITGSVVSDEASTEVSEDEETESSESASDASSENASDDGSAATEGTTSKKSNASKDASKESTSAPSKASKLVDSFYTIKGAELKNVYKSMKVIVNDQLKEMHTYWSDGNMAAVRDLAHLERFEAMSLQLSGSSDFYYYGDKDSTGQPDGTGLAVYADDQYYFGQWSGGKRSGEGTWICFYPSYSDNVVLEHLYTGGWSEDLPDGQGQEHADYNFDKLDSHEIYIQNAIGGFSKGLYDGEMYIITVDPDEDTTEWVGTCEKGSFEQIPYAAIDNNGLLPFLNEREDTENHIYLSTKGNKNIGIKGITTGGKIKQ